MSQDNPVETLPRILLVVRSIVIYKLKFLLIKRVDSTSYEPGKWEFPGGKLDAGEDVNKAMEREVMEEVGIMIFPVKSLVLYDSDIATDEKYKGIPFVRMIGLHRAETERVKIDESQHSEYKWVTFPEALNMDLTGVTRRALLGWEKELKDYLWKIA